MRAIGLSYFNTEQIEEILRDCKTGDEMARIASINQDKRYYTSTPELLKKYAQMVPPVDEQK